MKPIPPHILFGVCGECNVVLGIFSQDSMYGEGVMEHMADKDHRGMQIVSMPKHMIKMMLQEFLDEQEDPHEELLSP
jgi:hypothetical protein